MRRNGETAALMNNFAYFARRFSFQVRRLRADAKKVAIGSSHFDAGQNEKSVDRLAVETHQTFFEHVGHRVARVVIGHGDAVQAFRAPGRDQLLGSGNAVAGKKRMSVKIEIEGHWWGWMSILHCWRRQIKRAPRRARPVRMRLLIAFRSVD